jgi:hypothetical protein
MKQIQKLDNLIVKILKEELDEKRYAGQNSITSLQADPEYKKLNPTTQKDALKDLKAGGSITLENEKEKEVLENEVKASDIAGQVSEIVDKLKTMAESKDDPKKQKLAEKAMKQMESAKAALEALTAHEMMLEEKRQKDQEKLAEKNLKGVRKHLTKLVKEPSIVEKISSKMNAKRMAELKSKMKKELDEEQLARVMLQQSLKEGWIK